jgi:hypothetical protein
MSHVRAHSEFFETALTISDPCLKSLPLYVVYSIVYSMCRLYLSALLEMTT